MEHLELTQEDFQDVVDHLRRKESRFSSYALWVVHAVECPSCCPILLLTAVIFKGAPANVGGSIMDVANEVAAAAKSRDIEVDLVRDVSVPAVVERILRGLGERSIGPDGALVTHFL